MQFDCGVCGQRKEIVSFKPDGFVPGVINVPKSIAMCRECIDIPKHERDYQQAVTEQAGNLADTIDADILEKSQQEEDNDYPF